MKKIALMIVAAATLAASVSAPAEARSIRVRTGAAVAAATAAAIAADYYYGGGYYYNPGVVYYGPGYYGYPAVRYGW